MGRTDSLFWFIGVSKSTKYYNCYPMVNDTYTRNKSVTLFNAFFATLMEQTIEEKLEVMNKRTLLYISVGGLYYWFVYVALVFVKSVRE